MSTHAGIGIVKENGTVQMVYCHWDGYPEYTGKILMEHYTDFNKVNKLISMGQISFLRKDIGDKHLADTSEGMKLADQMGWTSFYSRDFKKIENKIIWKFESVYEAVQFAISNYHIFYIYLFHEENNRWKYMDLVNFKPLYFKRNNSVTTITPV